jgi:EF-hand domain pair
MSSQENPTSAQDVRRLFDEFDRDGNGVLDEDELRQMFSRFQRSDSGAHDVVDNDTVEATDINIEAVLRAADDNSDRVISRDEFQAVFSELCSRGSELAFLRPQYDDEDIEIGYEHWQDLFDAALEYIKQKPVTPKDDDSDSDVTKSNKASTDADADADADAIPDLDEAEIDAVIEVLREKDKFDDPDEKLPVDVCEEWKMIEQVVLQGISARAHDYPCSCDDVRCAKMQAKLTDDDRQFRTIAIICAMRIDSLNEFLEEHGFSIQLQVPAIAHDAMSMLKYSQHVFSHRVCVVKSQADQALKKAAVDIDRVRRMMYVQAALESLRDGRKSVVDVMENNRNGVEEKSTPADSGTSTDATAGAEAAAAAATANINVVAQPSDSDADSNEGPVSDDNHAPAQEDNEQVTYTTYTEYVDGYTEQFCCCGLQGHSCTKHVVGVGCCFCIGSDMAFERCSHRVDNMNSGVDEAMKRPWLRWSSAAFGVAYQLFSLGLDWLAQFELRDSCIRDYLNLDPWIEAQFIFCITATLAATFTLALFLWDVGSHIYYSCCCSSMDAATATERYQLNLDRHKTWSAFTAAFLQDFPQFFVLLGILSMTGFRRNDFIEMVAFGTSAVALMWFMSDSFTELAVLLKHTRRARERHRFARYSVRFLRPPVSTGVDTDEADKTADTNLATDNGNESSRIELRALAEPSSSRPDITFSNDDNSTTTAAAATSVSTDAESLHVPRVPTDITSPDAILFHNKTLQSSHPLDPGLRPLLRVSFMPRWVGITLFVFVMLLVLPMMTILLFPVTRLYSHNKPLFAGQMNFGLVACQHNQLCQVGMNNSQVPVYLNTSQCEAVQHFGNVSLPVWLKSTLAFELRYLRWNEPSSPYLEPQQLTIVGPRKVSWAVYEAEADQANWPKDDFFVKPRKVGLQPHEDYGMFWFNDDGIMRYSEEVGSNLRGPWTGRMPRLYVENEYAKLNPPGRWRSDIFWANRTQIGDVQSSQQYDCTSFHVDVEFVNADCTNTASEIEDGTNNAWQSMINVALPLIVYLLVLFTVLRLINNAKRFDPLIDVLIGSVAYLGSFWGVMLAFVDISIARDADMSTGALMAVIFVFACQAFVAKSLLNMRNEMIQRWAVVAAMDNRRCERTLVKIFVGYFPMIVMIGVGIAIFMGVFDDRPD